MNPLAAQGFRCPVCGRGLELCPGRLACSRGHSFDLAREGYANLLPVQKKHARQPGDSPLMVEARRRFLEGGHYALFAQALADLAADLARPGQPFRVMDAGCGEGYYDRALLPALVQKTGDARLIGFDISKEAVRLAARAQKEQAAFAVASCFAAPVRDGWADVLLNIFSPFAGKRSDAGIQQLHIMVMELPKGAGIQFLANPFHQVIVEIEVVHDGQAHTQV